MPARIPTATKSGSSKFFRTRLLTLDSHDIESYIAQLDQEADTIRSDSMKLMWYMRGSLSYQEVMNLSMRERGMIGDLAKENIETTKKTRLPWF